jgi:hypothetical protein
MKPWTGPMSDWLVDYYALTTVVLVAAVMVMGRLRQPARRLSVARSAVVGLAILAVLAALPGWPRASWRSRPWRTQPDRPTVAAAAGTDSGITTPAQLGTRPGPPQAMPKGPSQPAGSEESIRAWEALARPAVGASVRIPTVERTSEWPDLAGRAFVAGGALMLAWLAIGLSQTNVIRRQSRPAPQWSRDVLAQIVGTGRAAPDLLVSGWLAQPVAIGLLRPAIILPERFVEDEPRCRLEAALAHKWAHFRNRDLWWIALSGLLMPVLFAHPAYWWLRRRTREDQEVLADAAAADGRVDYAETLLARARQTPDWPRLAAAGSLALWERPSQLKRRILMLLDRDFRVEPTCPRRWDLGVRGATALSVVALSVLTFRPDAVVVGADPPGPQAARESGPKQDEAVESGATVTVLDPESKPAAGAAVYRTNASFRPFPKETGTAVLLTRTGPDGSFRLSRADAKVALDHTAQIVVTAEGCGPAFVDSSVGDGVNLIRLVKDDVPIRGRVIDLQGRPVAGASVRLVGMFWHPSGKLDEWLTVLNAEKAAYSVAYELLRSWVSNDVPSLYEPVIADRDGRFTLRGIGRERIASLLISGPGIETRCEYVATRDMPAVKVPAMNLPRQPELNIVYHGAAFDLAAGPGLEIVGTVRDKDTGRPLAGITVQTTMPFGDPGRYFMTTTDARGDYRLSGVPSKTPYGHEQDLRAGAKDGPPYAPSVQHLGDTRALGPIHKDFGLKRGAWARGRVTDLFTGKPVPAYLAYYILEDNPHLKDYPEYGTIRVQMPFQADENGEFRIAVIPGRGILGARFGNGPYRLGVGFDKIKGLKLLEGEFVVPTRPHSLMPMSFNTLVEIDPKEGEESVRADIGLDRGRTLKGRLVGPEGEAVAGALMFGAEDLDHRWSHQPLPTAEFEVRGLGSPRKRGLLFYHEAKQLAGAYVLKPDEEGPVSVRLEPCGTLSGRLVDNGGLPAAEAGMKCDRPYEGGDSIFEKGALPSTIKTDKDGRFRLSGLVPGLKYSLTVWTGSRFAVRAAEDVSTKAGELKDLGDIKVMADN